MFDELAMIGLKMPDLKVLQKMTNFKLKAGPKMFIFESFLSPNIRSGPPELKVFKSEF